MTVYTGRVSEAAGRDGGGRDIYSTLQSINLHILFQPPLFNIPKSHMSKYCLPAFAGARCDGVEGQAEFWVAGDRRATPADSTDAILTGGTFCSVSVNSKSSLSKILKVLVLY